MSFYTSVEELIGHTPLLALTNIQQKLNLKARILAKLEGFNPGGSAKDRVAIAMLDAAEEAGLIQPGALIIEPTSGNTGIGLSVVAAARGYRAVIVMPGNMSKERQLLMRAYGAEVVLSPAEEGMTGAIALANRLAAENPGSFIPGQFDNPANPKAHFDTTGPEIWEDTQGNVDIFVSGIGTGGTISGTGQYLKLHNPQLKVLGVEPASSPLLSKGTAGSHGLQGIGANFIPAVLDTGIYDEICPVTEKEAYEAARLLGKAEGFLAGISSGAALHAAIEAAKKEESTGKTIVVLLPDSGERYLSTWLFD